MSEYEGLKIQKDHIIVDRIAKVCHEVNRAYCHAIGDNSQVPWSEAPEWQKESAKNGVVMHLENPDATPEQIHANWLLEKADNGWQYGPIKDPEKKEHPCFLSYDELPTEQKAKDYIFRAIVHAMK